MGPMLDYIVEELDVQAYEDSISEKGEFIGKACIQCGFRRDKQMSDTG